VAGHVVELVVEDNQPVKKGQLLLRVDPRDLEARVAQVRASITMAESRLRAAAERVHVAREMASGQRVQAEASTLGAEYTHRSAVETVASLKAVVAARQAALGAVRAEVDRSRAMHERTQQDLERMAKLVKQDLVAQRDYDQAVTDAKTTEAAVRVAQERVTQAERDLASAEADTRIREAGYEPQGIGIGMAAVRGADARAKRIQAEAMLQEVRVREAERELAAAQLKEVQADVSMAELQLSYTQVRAPVDGVVAKRSVEIGQVVQVGQPLMAIVPLQDVWVVANFKETQLARVRPGMRAEIAVDTFPGRPYIGVVESISAGTGARFSLLPPENATGNWVKVVQRVPVKIKLENQRLENPHTLRAGMSALVTIRVR
jgi:membrane fusion protein (multidrug efflux system)